MNNDGALVKTIPGGSRLFFSFFRSADELLCSLSEVHFVPRKSEQTISGHIKYTTTELRVVVKYAIASGSSNCLMMKLVYIIWAPSGGGV